MKERTRAVKGIGMEHKKKSVKNKKFTIACYVFNWWDGRMSEEIEIYKVTWFKDRQTIFYLSMDIHPDLLLLPFLF